MNITYRHMCQTQTHYTSVYMFICDTATKFGVSSNARSPMKPRIFSWTCGRYCFLSEHRVKHEDKFDLCLARGYEWEDNELVMAGL